MYGEDLWKKILGSSSSIQREGRDRRSTKLGWIANSTGQHLPGCACVLPGCNRETLQSFIHSLNHPTLQFPNVFWSYKQNPFYQQKYFCFLISTQRGFCFAFFSVREGGGREDKYFIGWNVKLGELCRRILELVQQRALLRGRYPNGAQLPPRRRHSSQPAESAGSLGPGPSTPRWSHLPNTDRC